MIYPSSYFWSEHRSHTAKAVTATCLLLVGWTLSTSVEAQSASKAPLAPNPRVIGQNPPPGVGPEVVVPSINLPGPGSGPGIPVGGPVKLPIPVTGDKSPTGVPSPGAGGGGGTPVLVAPANIPPPPPPATQPPSITPAPVIPVTAQPAVVPTPRPVSGNLPPPGAGNTIALPTPPVTIIDVPPKPVTILDGNPTPGGGPKPNSPPIFGSVSTTPPLPTAVPIDPRGAGPGAGGATLQSSNVPTPAPPGAGATSSATPLVMNATNSNIGAPGVLRKKAAPPGQSNEDLQLTRQTHGNSGSALNEILPSSQQLMDSMQAQDKLDPARLATNQAQALPAAQACVAISLRPDPQRASTTLVDFAGDGLIVSAVANAHVSNVFARAGYNNIQITQPVRWCVAQAAVRELIRPTASASVQQASLLVETSSGWQLMSQEQWLTYQASLAPLQTAVNVSAKKPAASSVRIARNATNKTTKKTAAGPTASRSAKLPMQVSAAPSELRLK
jgi:hypothetical protein